MATPLSTSSSYAAPHRLRAERLCDPLGLDVARPALSWSLNWSERGAAQTAARVVAARSIAALEAGDVLWDSGETKTGAGELPYDGSALSSRQRVYWQVQVWDEAGRVTPWSEAAFWEMGLLLPDDWNPIARWIGNHGMTVPLFRRAFRLEQAPEQIETARLYSSGIGYYEPRLNGQKLGDQALAPEYTDYEQRIAYNTFDVGPQLRAGDNVLGVVLAGGYVSHFQYGTPMFRAQLEVRYLDGSEQLVDTEKGPWQVSPGAWRECDIFNGEWFDARLDQAGWDTPEFNSDNGQWNPVFLTHDPARALEPPGGKLVGLRNEPVRVTQDLPVQSVTQVRPGVFVVDFGQNFAGWVKVKARGAAGSGLSLRFGEFLKDDGRVEQINLRTARNTDHYILNGQGEEEWEPRFCYHGFQFVEVEGAPQLPEKWELVGRVVHSDVPRRGRFECSDARLSQLFQNTDWTLRSNMVSVFSDCPQRDERQGWFADAHLSAETALHHFDAGAFYHKWMEDVRDVQDKERDHRWSPTAPVWATSGRTRPPFLFSDPAKQTDVVWTAAGTLIPWFVYLYNGDLPLIEEHFPAIEAHLEFLSSQSEAPLAPFNQFGDWLHSTFDRAPDPTDKVLLSTAFFLEQCRRAAQMARALNKPQSQRRWEEQSEKIIAALRSNFYDAKNHTFGSQTADALALHFGYAPLEERTQILAHLIDDIEEKCDGHLATGIVGTKFLLETLCAQGRFDVAFKVVTAEGYPGWMEMLRNGATTITERWNFSGDYGMNSHNHPVFGVVSGWMFRWLAGVRVDEDLPAYQHFWIAPETPTELSWAQAELETVRGRVFSRWQREENGLSLEIVVPQGARATVVFPGSENARVSLSDEDGAPFVSFGERDGRTGRQTAQVSSGHYRFQIGGSDARA